MGVVLSGKFPKMDEVVLERAFDDVSLEQRFLNGGILDTDFSIVCETEC